MPYREASAAALRESCTSRWSSLGCQFCYCRLTLSASPVCKSPASEGVSFLVISVLTLNSISHVDSGGRLVNCLAVAKHVRHLTMMHLSSISFSMSRLPVFGQLLRALMNSSSLQPEQGVSSVRSLQSHRLRSLRWCRPCLTSRDWLILYRRGCSRSVSLRTKRAKGELLFPASSY